MPKYSKRSLRKLVKCDLRLIHLFRKVVKYVDNTILYGYRDEKLQNWLYKKGFTKVKFPNSKHNSFPSKAVDAVPYPIKWPKRTIKQMPKDVRDDVIALVRFYYFAGFVKGMGAEMGLKIRWGGDWDNDNDFMDQRFDDLDHFELME